MKWDAARADPSASASPGRHRAPEHATVDGLTDTVLISPRCSTYGRHAARSAALPKIAPAASTRAESAEDVAAVPEPDADASPSGKRTTSRRWTALASYLRPRATQRSA